MFKDRGVRFLGVNVYWDNEGAARMFVQGRRVPYAVGHDTGNRVGSLYGVQSTPTTFLLARDGNVAAVAQGSMELETLTVVLEQLLTKQ
ncbi:MAG: TlpA family protein disulfide reductase [candidate division NC10 bacterium]|jgi:peroxiredoxin|nr:TlpA family protein disulfide reductase [candidate division NC10 bacterium]MCH7896365.1 TlpA family protein disulfide reductase [candidate division NC10 bacterium]